MAKQYKFHCVFQFYDDSSFFCDVYSDDIGHAYIKAINQLIQNNKDILDCDLLSINFIE